MRYPAFVILLMLLCCHRSGAQICNGSLGDPIVNLTFGAGSNPGAPLLAAATNYTYYNSDCPNDGYYTVSNSTSNCFSSSWHSVLRDHTGDPGGYFMLVNASIQPGAFFVDTVKGLCSNTSFEFAAWIVNVLKPSSCGGGGIQPSLTFNLEKTDGTVLQTYNTGFIAADNSPQWKQYGFFFSTPPGISDVVLRIFNNSAGGCGNDLALDDITFRPCGPQISTSVDGYTGNNVFYCEQTARSFTLRSTVPGFTSPAFQWQQSADGITWTDIPGANSSVYTANFAASAQGMVRYRMAAAEAVNFNSVKCRVLSPVITVTKGTQPVATMRISSPACEGEPLTFAATGGNSYLWYREGGGLGVPQANFTIPVADLNLAGKIYVKVEGSPGCFTIDSSILTILPKPKAILLFDSATICKGNSIPLGASGGVSYQWEPVAGLSDAAVANPLATPLVTTAYTLTVTGANTCPDRDTVVITVVESITADAGEDKVIVKGDAVQLVNSTANGIYSWSPSTYLDNPGSKEPVATPPQNMSYVLTAVSPAGCNTDMDTVNIIVFNDIYIPNAFSPDGNGNNDRWNIPALLAFPGFELQVYNRSGNIVYQCRNQFVPWDGYYKGTPLEAGNYVYLLQLNDKKKRVLKGNVLLLR